MPKTRTQLYEGMYILNAALSEDARAKALDKLQQQIVSRGGEIHKIHDWGRRRLAYEIGGRREGYYYILYFSVPTQEMAEMWKEYHLNEDLVRFVTFQAEKVLEKIEFKPLLALEQ